jgi:hypothetical protein
MRAEAAAVERANEARRSKKGEPASEAAKTGKLGGLETRFALETLATLVVLLLAHCRYCTTNYLITLKPTFVVGIPLLRKKHSSFAYYNWTAPTDYTITARRRQQNRD